VISFECDPSNVLDCRVSLNATNQDLFESDFSDIVSTGDTISFDTLKVALPRILNTLSTEGMAGQHLFFLLSRYQSAVALASIRGSVKNQTDLVQSCFRPTVEDLAALPTGTLLLSLEILDSRFICCSYSSDTKEFSQPDIISLINSSLLEQVDAALRCLVTGQEVDIILFLGEQFFAYDIDSLLKSWVHRRSYAIDISWGFFRYKLLDIQRLPFSTAKIFPLLKPKEILVFSPAFRDVADQLMASSGIAGVESSRRLQISRGDILSSIKVITFMSLNENSESRLWNIHGC
jgi:hypothetical protein